MGASERASEVGVKANWKTTLRSAGKLILRSTVLQQYSSVTMVRLHLHTIANEY